MLTSQRTLDDRKTTQNMAVTGNPTSRGQTGRQEAITH